MFLSRNKKDNVYPCKPQFYYLKMGFKGSKLYSYVFVMDMFPMSPQKYVLWVLIRNASSSTYCKHLKHILLDKPETI